MVLSHFTQITKLAVVKIRDTITRDTITLSLHTVPGNCRKPNYKIHFGKGSSFSNFGLKIVFNCLKNLVSVVMEAERRGCSL